MSSGNLFPSTVFNRCLRKPVSVELKDGTTYNGILASADKWMNLVLTDVIVTHHSGTKFTKVMSVCVRGAGVRTVRVVKEALESDDAPLNKAKRSISKKERAAKYARHENKSVT